MSKKIIRAVKIRLLPTVEQEKLFWRSAGTARWAYNYFLAENLRIYEQYILNGRTGAYCANESEVRKYINNVLKKTTHIWLNDIGSNVVKQAIKDAGKALKDFFSGFSGRPRFKSKHKAKISFYVNYERLSRKGNFFQGEKLGVVKMMNALPKIPKGKKYINPHISYDGKYWYLSVGYEVMCVNESLGKECLGIDLGIKNLAVVANRDASYVKVYENINKSRKVKLLECRLKREQRRLERKFKAKEKAKSKNIEKQNRKIRSIYKHITDIRKNYVHQITAELVKTKPGRIVLENLNVSGMMRNKYLSKDIASQNFAEFKRQILYKAEAIGIEVVEADRFFASSKKCSGCGCIKKHLRLGERVYKCELCGYVIDRDLNAAINLANYCKEK